MPRRTAEIASDTNSIHLISTKLKTWNSFFRERRGTPSHTPFHTTFYPSNLPRTPYSCLHWNFYFFSPSRSWVCIFLSLSSSSDSSWVLLKSSIWSEDQNHSAHMAHVAPRGTAQRENSWSSRDPRFQLRCSLSSWSHLPGVTGGSFFQVVSLFPDTLGQELPHAVLSSDALLQGQGTLALWSMHKPWHGGGTRELAPWCVQALPVLFLFLHESTSKHSLPLCSSVPLGLLKISCAFNLDLSPVGQK